jgi:23S rRNA pseudouridine2605 synthase
MAKERAQKIIAAAGLMSRRKAEEAIAAGRVALNGEVFTDLGRTLDLERDVLTLDGLPVKKPEVKRTFLFHKPRGVMTTKDDPEGRPTIMDFFRDEPGLNPVGRLDFDSEGLLLLTHDGDLLLKLTHPRYGILKVYEVELEGKGMQGFHSALLSSVELSDGPGKFDQLEELPRRNGNRAFRVSVSEGRNRFVRRMFGAVGFSVVRLIRVRMGEFELGTLKPGERREWIPE